MNIKILTEDNYETKNNFINYLIKQLQKLIIEKYNKEKSFIIEKYINDNEIIKYRYSDKYTSVLDLYKIAVSNLKTKSYEKSNMYNITVDKNIMIPGSNTYLISIVKLLEFGNLEIQKYGLLENCMQYICDNLDTFYNKFKIEYEEENWKCVKKSIKKPFKDF